MNYNGSRYAELKSRVPNAGIMAVAPNDHHRNSLGVPLWAAKAFDRDGAVVETNFTAPGARSAQRSTSRPAVQAPSV